MLKLWFSLCLATAALAQAPVRALIVTGETDLPYHDWRQNAPILRSILENSGRFDTKTIEDPRGLTPELLANYDVLVLYYNGPRWGEAAERATEAFLRNGGGMIAVHCVSYGPFYGQVLNPRFAKIPDVDKPWPAYADMMGVTWKRENIGHSWRHVYPVTWTDKEHPIVRGLPPMFVADDELYHKMDHKPNVHVLASAYSDPAQNGTGKAEPVMWTVPFGKGRVVHMTLGHDASAMVQPGFSTALARGAEWAATAAVTLPVRIDAAPAKSAGAVRAIVVTSGHSYPSSFYTLFEGRSDVRWSHATTHEQAFRPKMRERYDVVVLHDMHETIAEPHKLALQEFLESGGGLVSIHHSIVNYTSWPWFYEQVTGGKYWQKKSTYKEGVELIANPVRKHARHPVMVGVGPIVLEHDETYQGMWHSPEITVLMETPSEANDKPVVYLGPSKDIRSVYIQPGHGEEAFRHPGYRRLVHNAILWAGRPERTQQ